MGEILLIVLLAAFGIVFILFLQKLKKVLAGHSAVKEAEIEALNAALAHKLEEVQKNEGEKKFPNDVSPG